VGWASRQGAESYDLSWLLPQLFPRRLQTGRLRKIDIRQLLTGEGEGVVEEPNHATARKPGPRYLIQYSLTNSYEKSNHSLKIGTKTICPVHLVDSFYSVSIVQEDDDLGVHACARRHKKWSLCHTLQQGKRTRVHQVGKNYKVIMYSTKRPRLVFF
jgi:hypothetical protein